MVNLFDLTFGKLPNNFLSRDNLISEICYDFCSEVPSSNLYVISGVRGSGKTVLLNKVHNMMSEETDWVTVKVNPDRDILEQIAANIYESESVKHLFLKPSFSFSFHGLTFSIDGKTPISNIKSLLEKMLIHLKKHNKKLLVSIDEVTNSKEMKSFAHDFQSFLGDGYEIFLLMTGLYENIHSLQNNKTLTFLYRAPKIYLEPLDLIDVFNSYKKIFNNEKESVIKELTLLTNGYAYAYQLLGSLFTKEEKITDKLLEDYDKKLKDYCYDKIYDNIPTSELALLKVIPENGKCSSKYIVENCSMSIKQISVLKDRLIKRGILKNQKGVFEILLPRFRNFISINEEFNI